MKEVLNQMFISNRNPIVRSRRSFATLLTGTAAAVCAITFSTAFAAESHGVRVWEEKTVIPTYLAGAPEPNPMFFFGRESQGALAPVYPYPLFDSLTGKKVDKTYTIVRLENEYIRLGILPELGGRLFEGVDKTNNYNFVYRQHVIKPALIGLLGAWISGGIEWNIPHHHRVKQMLNWNLPGRANVLRSVRAARTRVRMEPTMRSRSTWPVEAPPPTHRL